MQHRPSNAVTYTDFAGLILALLAAVCVAALLVVFSWQEQDAQSLVRHTREVFQISQQLLVRCAQADTGARSYMLTANPKYLEQYKTARSTLKSESENLSNIARTPRLKNTLRNQLAPLLSSFLSTADDLIATQSISPMTMQQLDVAAIAYNKAVENLQMTELEILQERRSRLTDISLQNAWIRFLLLLIAFVAIVFSIMTLQSVMKKDRQKISSLKAEVELRRLAEEAAYQARDEARKSNELKTQFMSNISHEIRTPMTGVLGMAELMCQMKLDDTSQSYSRVLLTSARQLLDVLNDLLNFSKLDHGDVSLEPHPFVIRQTLNDVMGWATIEAREKKLSLSTFVDDSVPAMVIGDEDKIRQVITVFVANAIKFTKSGGIKICLDLLDSKHVRISVADTGIGISTQDLNRIFQPFVQADGGTKRNFNGTGLSLSIAKHIVDLMSGQVGVLSEPALGSVFWFAFDIRGAQ